MSEDGGKEAFVRAGHTPTEPKARKSQSWSLAQKTVAQHICRQSSTAKLVQWEKTAHSNVMNPTPPHPTPKVGSRRGQLTWKVEASTCGATPSGVTGVPPTALLGFSQE